MIDKCLLQGMQLAGAGKTLDRQHVFVRNIPEQSHARMCGTAFNQDGARTAEPFSAAILGSSERKVRAQYPEQCAVILSVHGHAAAVESKADQTLHNIYPKPRLATPRQLQMIIAVTPRMSSRERSFDRSRDD